MGAPAVGTSPYPRPKICYPQNTPGKIPAWGLFIFPRHRYCVCMGPVAISLLSYLPSLSSQGKLTVGILQERQHEELTEFIARLALSGPFHLIVGGEWLPDQDSLRRAVRRHTTTFMEVLEHPILGRPSTCFQLRDQLEKTEYQPHPVLILNFLHHFYDPDIELTLRQRVLADCCQRVQVLAISRPVLVLVRVMPAAEYPLFLQPLTSIASEIIEIQEKPNTEAIQASLF